MEFTGERYIPGQGGAIELEHLNRYYFVVNQIDLTGKTVLDIASGEGYGANILAQHAAQVFGVDISLEAIEHARSKYIRQNLTFFKGNANSIPIDDGIIDVVVCFETIEHHDMHSEMLNEIKRVLNPNGKLIISSPDKKIFLTKYKIEFHVKELYSEEFKILIRGYFKKTLFYSQKTFVGSIIALNENKQEYKKPILIKNEGISSEFCPAYNIAIGTDDIDFMPSNQVVLYQTFDEILSNIDIEVAKQSIRDTQAYRIGKFVLRPLSFIQLKFKI
jgi:ubiquinone/menaquinone biosynthesis C-methylase UbiE